MPHQQHKTQMRRMPQGPVEVAGKETERVAGSVVGRRKTPVTVAPTPAGRIATGRGQAIGPALARAIRPDAGDGQVCPAQDRSRWTIPSGWWARATEYMKPKQARAASHQTKRWPRPRPGRSAR